MCTKGILGFLRRDLKDRKLGCLTVEIKEGVHQDEERTGVIFSPVNEESHFSFKIFNFNFFFGWERMSETETPVDGVGKSQDRTFYSIWNRME